jgi:hypothetical protein
LKAWLSIQIQTSLKQCRSCEGGLFLLTEGHWAPSPQEKIA